MAKNELTPEEEDIRQQLVKIAADNDIYFVLWYGHFNNYFVGMRNSRKKEPEIYGAMYEMFYDVVENDAILFKLNIGQEFDWRELLQKSRAAVEGLHRHAESV